MSCTHVRTSSSAVGGGGGGLRSRVGTRSGTFLLGGSGGTQVSRMGLANLRRALTRRVPAFCQMQLPAAGVSASTVLDFGPAEAGGVYDGRLLAPSPGAGASSAAAAAAAASSARAAHGSSATPSAASLPLSAAAAAAAGASSVPSFMRRGAPASHAPAWYASHALSTRASCCTYRASSMYSGRPLSRWALRLSTCSADTTHRILPLRPSCPAAWGQLTDSRGPPPGNCSPATRVILPCKPSLPPTTSTAGCSSGGRPASSPNSSSATLLPC
mmetsp:Transcript_33676/g.74577  ORF Transcript_33676/g.74577 Transcript_33676/m.74577 type:complete len:272 (-) Transcript_33676:1052-1867(-)